MNVLIDLQDKLRTNTEAIGRLESALATTPASVILHANLRSLKKLHSSLEEQFEAARKQIGIDVCRYRILEDRPTARGLANALNGFQDTFSVAFEALKSGPMMRRVIPKDTLAATELRVAYTYPGSFGVVLTVPRERLLFDDWATQADQAIDVVFGIAKAKSSREVASVARQLGPAPIAALYDWAKDNAQSRVGADVEWSPDTSKQTARNLFLQYPEFEEISHSIEETSDETITVQDYPGSLVGADTKTRRFHFVTDRLETIRGKFFDAISSGQQATLPERYVATMRVHRRTNFAKGEEEAAYELLKLAPR